MQQNERRSMKRFGLPIGIIVVMTVASGYLQGQLSGRWGVPDDVEAIGERVGVFPREIGAWHAVSEEKLSDGVIKELQCGGYVSREYRNAKTGERVAIILLFGPSGTMTAHSPDVCYGAQGHTVIGDAEQVMIASENGIEGEFLVQGLKSDGLGGGDLRVYYGWWADGKWTAPKLARLRLAGHRYLYKVQVQTRVDSSAAQEDAGRRFLAQFIDAAEGELGER